MSTSPDELSGCTHLFKCVFDSPPFVSVFAPECDVAQMSELTMIRSEKTLWCLQDSVQESPCMLIELPYKR